MAVEKETKKDEQKDTTFEAFASVNPYQQMYFDTNYPNAMSTFANYTIPTDQREMIRKVKEIREYDVVDYFLRLKCDYGLPIQEIKCSKPMQQKFYDRYVLPLVQDFARQFSYEYWSVGEVFGHYGFKDKKFPMYLVAEDPESITPCSALGIETYEIRISNTLKQQLKKLKEQNQLDRLPQYLRNAINEKGQVKDKVILDNKHMVRLCNQKPDYQLRPKPILLKVAKSLILREFLIDIDYVNAFSSQKSNFTHVQCGDKDTVKQWDSTKMKEVHDLVTDRPPGDAVVTTRFDVKISQINTTADLFDPKRFEECNKRILNFFGLSAVYMPSEAGGINNSTVLVSTKPFEESIQSDRKAFEKFLKVYFQEVNKLNGFQEVPKVIYKTTNIRDSKELREELEFLCGKGILGYEDLCVIFNKDRDIQVNKREWDWQHRDIIAPYYEESQGLQPQLTEAVKQKIKIGKETKQEPSVTNNNQTKSRQEVGDG